MGNKFAANILMCKNITEEKEFKDVFNNITLTDEHAIEFDMGIFFTSDVQEVKEELFLVNISHETEEAINYHLIGTIIKKFDKIGKNIDLNIFRDNKVDFKWEGLYNLELRLCKERKDINVLENDEIVDWIEKSELINSFSFSVKFKNED